MFIAIIIINALVFKSSPYWVGSEYVMIRKSKTDIRNFLLHLLLFFCNLSACMDVFASFKTNDEIFNSVRLCQPSSI